MDKPVDIDQPGVDSVAEDISKFKSTVKKLTDTINQKTKPVAEKVQQGIAERAPAAIKEKIGQKPKLSWIKYLFIPIFIIFILVIIYRVLQDSPGNGEQTNVQEPTGVIEPTPTIEPVGPSRQSVYVNDPEIQRLQDELDVINNEMFSVPLRDSSLNPPVLDFNVSF